MANANTYMSDERTRNLESCNIVENDKKSVEKELKLLDIPFNWSLSQAEPHGEKSYVLIARIEEKIEEIFELTEFKIRSFSLRILIAFELTKTNINEALEKIRECEQLINFHKNNDCQEHLFISIIDSLQYMTMGCKAYIMFKLGIISETKEILQKMPKFDTMSNEQKSGIYGIKALITMEYGTDGSVKSYEYAVKAKELNPTIAEWHFQIGKIIGRIRRVKSPLSSPSEEEIDYLKKSYEMSNGNASYLLHLAQTYREASFRMFNEIRYAIKKNEDINNKVKELNKKSCDIYRKLLDLNTNNSHLLARCAFGLVKLPIPFRDVDLAVKSIESALVLSPNNPMINHYAALIHERHTKNYEEAEKYYKLASSLNTYGAEMDLIRFKYSRNRKEYDPLSDLKNALRYKEQDRYLQTLSQLASWYFFRKLDILEAWNYINEVIKTNPNCNSIRKHKSLFLRMNEFCDLCEVMLDDVKFRMAHQTYETEKEKDMLMEIGQQLKTICPDSHPKWYNNLKRKILDKSNELVMKAENLDKKTGKYRRGKRTCYKGKNNFSNQIKNSNSQSRKFGQERSKSRGSRNNSFNRNVSKDKTYRASSKETSNRNFSKDNYRASSQEMSYRNNSKDKKYGASSQEASYRNGSKDWNYRASSQETSYRNGSKDKNYGASSQEASYRNVSKDRNYRASSQEASYRNNSKDKNYVASSQEASYRNGSKDWNYRASSQEASYRNSSKDWNYRSSSQEPSYRNGSKDWNYRSSSQEPSYRNGSKDWNYRSSSEDKRRFVNRNRSLSAGKKFGSKQKLMSEENIENISLKPSVDSAAWQTGCKGNLTGYKGFYKC